MSTHLNTYKTLSYLEWKCQSLLHFSFAICLDISSCCLTLPNHLTYSKYEQRMFEIKSPKILMSTHSNTYKTLSYLEWKCQSLLHFSFAICSDISSCFSTLPNHLTYSEYEQKVIEIKSSKILMSTHLNTYKTLSYLKWKCQSLLYFSFAICSNISTCCLTLPNHLT